MNDNYAGMTVNERLYTSGLIDDFDEALERRDFEKMQIILMKVGLTKDAIEPIMEKLCPDRSFQ